MSQPDLERPSASYFDDAYRQTPPWDIGAAQPALLALCDEFPPVSPVLDVGCGSGDLALALSGRGLTVVGVDMAPAAVDQARAKAAAWVSASGGSVQFVVGDALRPSQLPGPFATVVDTGFLHVFESAQRDDFVQELSAALVNGGRYYLLGLSTTYPFTNAPRQVSEDELRERFSMARGWRILALRPAQFLIGPTRMPLPAVAACMERI
jgi:SAM-dependent methyltransferase